MVAEIDELPLNLVEVLAQPVVSFRLSCHRLNVSQESGTTSPKLSRDARKRQACTRRKIASQPANPRKVSALAPPGEQSAIHTLPLGDPLDKTSWRERLDCERAVGAQGLEN
jgi:hypothetical protein